MADFLSAVAVCGVSGANPWFLDVFPPRPVVYMVPGTSRIAFTPNGGRIDLSVTEGPTSAVFRTNDTGPSIPEEQRQRVFNSFYRIRGSEGTGSGLGLSIVQSIANKIGATVSFNHAHPASKSGLSIQVAFRLAQMTWALENVLTAMCCALAVWLPTSVDFASIRYVRTS